MNAWPYSTLRQGISDLGTLGPAALMTLALVVACVATRRWSGAVLAAVAAPAASGLTEYVLKPYIGRPLDAGFPSGHATSMFALAVVCAVLLAKPPRRRVPAAVRLLLTFMALALATTVTVTMIAWGAHTFTEALAGAAVGTGVALACALTFDLLTSRALSTLTGPPSHCGASVDRVVTPASPSTRAPRRWLTEARKLPYRNKRCSLRMYQTNPARDLYCSAAI